MAKQLTYKEQKLIQGIASGKTKQQAAIEAYDATTPQSASVIASEALRKPHVQVALQKALKKHGIDLDSAIAPIGKALRATKVEIHGSGDQAFAEVVDDIDLQLKGSDRALKLMNVTNNNEGGTTNYNFVNVVANDKQEFGQ